MGSSFPARVKQVIPILGQKAPDLPCYEFSRPRYVQDTKNRNVAVARLRYVAFQHRPCYDQVTINRNVGASHVHPSVKCTNNSTKPIDSFNVSVWGKQSTSLGIDKNYFESISVYSTDQQISKQGADSGGIIIQIESSGINPGQSKELTLTIAATKIGGYRGTIWGCVAQGEIYSCFRPEILTSVK